MEMATVIKRQESPICLMGAVEACGIWRSCELGDSVGGNWKKRFVRHLLESGKMEFINPTLLRTLDKSLVV